MSAPRTIAPLRFIGGWASGTSAPLRCSAFLARISESDLFQSQEFIRTGLFPRPHTPVVFTPQATLRSGRGPSPVLSDSLFLRRKRRSRWNWAFGSLTGLRRLTEGGHRDNGAIAGGHLYNTNRGLRALIDAARSLGGRYGGLTIRPPAATTRDFHVAAAVSII